MFRRRTNTTSKLSRRKRKSAALRTSRIEQLEDRRMLAAFDLSQMINLPEIESNQIIDEVVIDGDTMVVETNEINSLSWAVSVYSRNDQGTPFDQTDDSWEFEKTLMEESTFDIYSLEPDFLSLAVSKNTVVIGSRSASGYSVWGTSLLGNADGAILPRPSGPSTGSVYVFDGSSGWESVTETILTPSNGYVGDDYGRSVAISGTTLIVGASRDNGSSESPIVSFGAAYVYDGALGWENAVETKLTSSESATHDFFGSSVAIDGSTIVVGASGVNNFQGAVYVFDGSAGWDLAVEHKLTSSSGASWDRLGTSVAISGSHIAVGSPGDNNSQGAVYVIDGSAGWTNAIEIKLTDINGDEDDRLGSKVDISEDVVVALGGREQLTVPEFVVTEFGIIGSRLARQVSVYDSIYVFDGTSGWDNTITTQLDAPGPLNLFGPTAAISGSTIVTSSAISNDDEQASVLVYERTNVNQSFPLPGNEDTDSTYPRKTGSIKSDIGTLNQLAVDSIPFFVATMSDPQDGGRTAVTSRKTLSALNVHREITVPNSWNVDYSRTVDVFSNITGVKLDTTVTYTSSLASGTNTSVFMTSDGDTILEPTDLWVGTYDANDPESTSMIHLLRGTSGIMPNSVTLVDGELQWEYDITVPAGEEVRLGVFNIADVGTSETIAAAESLIQLTGFSNGADDYLTDDEKASLVNFQFLDKPVFSAKISGGPINVYDIHEWSDFRLRLRVRIPTNLDHPVSQIKFTINVNELNVSLDFENMHLSNYVTSFDIEYLPGKVLITATFDSHRSSIGGAMSIADIPINVLIASDVVGEYPEINDNELISISDSRVYLDQVAKPLYGINEVVDYIRTLHVVPYDMNDDDKIGLTDLSLFLNFLGENTNDNPLAFRADFDRNGNVDLVDLLGFIRNFGKEKGDGEIISLPWDRFGIPPLIRETPIEPYTICPPFPNYPILLDDTVPQIVSIIFPGVTQSGSTDAAVDNAGLSFSSDTSFTSGQISTGEGSDGQAVELSLSDVESVLALQQLVPEDQDLLALLAESQAAGQISYASEDQQAIDDLFAQWGL
ncbi:MAG: hypothetical protein COA78_18195 [Blastopirellula sp.]|nr:MAG: hypothetical protein COA78_18195 [Blastopirellula sp.]